ncbi:MAG: c-type cytochrome [Halioglobus sp.]|jgi:mono/diheme cytochrome c family protein|nr:c-type cytochrome [Halioglobus sp.]
MYKHRRPDLPVLALAGVLCAALCAPVAAAVDPYDQQSLATGAELYDLYCSECHGVDSAATYSELYDTVQMDVSDDYDELVELVRGADDPEPIYEAPEEDWPEWAEVPPPEREPDVRAEVLGTVTRAIDTVQKSSVESDYWGGGASGNAARFDPVPGATNLADPLGYFYGTSEEDIFNSIADGTGAAMPGWRTELGGDEAIWDLVNYVRSLWGEEWRY